MRYEDLAIRKERAYDDFVEEMRRHVEEVDPETLDEKNRKLYDYTKLNLHRTKRLAKTFTPSEEAREAMEMIDVPQRWTIMTEAWCGDSAQSAPIVAKLAALNSNVKLAVFLRDENPTAQERLEAEGSKGIPILLAFDAKGEELFRWGPRPKEAAALVKRLKAEGEPKEKFVERAHVWYAKDRGKSIEREVVEAASGAIRD
jgi:hypothetical protein